MVVRNLEFFDRDGYNLNLNWNEQKRVWEGNIFFPKVSVGLYENTTIYVVEYVGNNKPYTNDGYTYPEGDGNIVFEWDLANSFVDEFFMFNFDENYELKDTSSLVYTPYDGPLCETLIVNRFEKYTTPLFNTSKSDNPQVALKFTLLTNLVKLLKDLSVVVSFASSLTLSPVKTVSSVP